MKINNISIQIKNDGLTRIKLTKRLPNGNTFVRYINQGEKQEICNSLENYINDYEQKLKTLQL